MLGKNQKETWFFYCERSHISGGNRDGTAPCSLSLGWHPENVELIKRIGKYFGGYIDEESGDDKEYYVEKTEDFCMTKLTNLQKLRNLIYDKTNYKIGSEVLRIIQENKQEILNLNFGEDDEIKSEDVDKKLSETMYLDIG